MYKRQSLVIAAGAELFTGNNFVMTSAVLGKTASWSDTIKLWVVCYIGNFVGSWILVGIFQLTGIPSGDVAAHFASAAETKMSLTPMEMLTRGIPVSYTHLPGQVQRSSINAISA